MKSGMITYEILVPVETLTIPVDIYYTVRNGRIEIDKICLPDVEPLLKADEEEVHRAIMEDMNERD